jgi:hypothetical protein
MAGRSYADTQLHVTSDAYWGLPIGEWQEGLRRGKSEVSSLFLQCTTNGPTGDTGGKWHIPKVNYINSAVGGGFCGTIVDILFL